MSVTSVQEYSLNAAATESWNGIRIIRKYTRQFKVVVDDVNDGDWTVLQDSRLPQIGDLYIAGNDYDPFGICINRSARKPTNSWNYHEVTIEYESYDNPLLRPHIISTGTATRERICWQDVWRLTAAGPGQPLAPVPIVNSAGQYFDPPVTVEQTDSTFSIQRNESIAIDPIALNTLFADTLNLDLFFGCFPGTVKCIGVIGVDTFESGMWFWQMTYNFAFRPEGWTLWLLDQGTMQLGANGKPQKIADPNGGGFVSEPVPLDGTGKALYRTKSPPGPGDFVFRRFDVFLGNTFAVLNLP